MEWGELVDASILHWGEIYTRYLRRKTENWGMGGLVGEIVLGEWIIK